MPVRVEEAQLQERGRVAGVAIAEYTMRSMERWRRNLADYDGAMIMVAVIAIGAGRLLRTGFPPSYRSLAEPIDPSLLAKVNIASIAHATGLNRETARRRVNHLVDRGLLARSADGGVGFSPGLTQESRVREQIQGQLREIAAIANQLLRLGVLAED